VARLVRCILLLASALVVAAAALMVAPPAGASSYPGSGDWTIPSFAVETVTGETLAISGNLSVAGSLTLLNSTLTVDRNVSVSGALTLRNTSLTFTVDGPGTNFITAAADGSLRVLDFDGLPSTQGDASRLSADAFAFNSTFAPNSTLTIHNSRVERAGWATASPPALRGGFRVDRGALNVSGSSFVGGFEVFVVTNSTAVLILNSTFEAVATAVNLTGGAGHRLSGIVLSNHTYGVRIQGASDLTVERLTAGPAAGAAYDAPGAPPRGTALSLNLSTRVAITDLNVSGPPSAPAPRGITGFVIRNSSFVNLTAFFGSWGDIGGQVTGSQDLAFADIRMTNFGGPFLISVCTNVSISGFRGSGERAGIQIASSVNISIRDLVVQGLSVPAVEAPGSSGSFELVGAVVADATAAASVTGNTTAPRFENLTLLNVTYGVLVSQPSGSGASFVGVVARQVVGNLFDLTFATAVGFTALDIDAENVSGIILNFTAAAASQLNIGRWRLNATDGDVLRLNVTALDNLSFAAVAANLHLGSLVHIETNASADLQFRNLQSSNSSGILLLANGGNLDRVRLYNLTLVQGDQPPAGGPPASIVLDASGQGGSHPAGRVGAGEVIEFTTNVSNRGGIYVAAGQSSSMRVENVSVLSAQLDGVRIVAGGGVWDLLISNLSYNGTGAAAVRLEGVAGALIRDLVATSATAVQLYSARDVRAQNITHVGAYAALVITGGGNVSAGNVSSASGFGVDVTLCAGLALSDFRVQASVWAVRVSYSTGLILDGLAATNTTGGIALLGVGGASVKNLTVDFAGPGFDISQGSRDVSLRTVAAATPTGVTSGMLLHIAFGTNVTVGELTFAGRCRRSALVESSTAVEIFGFRADTCGEGLQISSGRFVNVTGLFVSGAFNGSGLIIANSQDVRVTVANLTGARMTAIIVSGVDRVRLAGLAASNSGGDGALLAFASNLSLDGADLDGAAGACLRLLYTARNVTLTNVSARRGLAGVEVLASANVTLSGVNASLNGGIGLYTDLLSSRVTLRNITAMGNLWEGVLVSVNGTRFIDGNISGNGQSGLAVAPFVRLDWWVEGQARLTDETVDLTGDLTLGPGASFTATRSNLTVEQTVRRRALEPYARVTLGENATLSLDRSALLPRDVRIPYSVELQAGARLVLTSSLLEGGAKGDATSSVNGTSATVSAADSDFTGWYAPLTLSGGALDCRNCAFSSNREGPSVSGAEVQLSWFNSTGNDVDGLTVKGSPLLTLSGGYIEFNGGFGARIDDVEMVVVDRLSLLGNALGGMEVRRSNLSATDLAVLDSTGPGLYVGQGGSASLAGLTVFSNGGAGGTFEDLGSVVLSDLQVHENGGAGLQFLRVGRATLWGGEIGGNGLFGIFAKDALNLEAEGVDFVGDQDASAWMEGTSLVSIGNASLNTSADHVVVLRDSSQATLTNLRLTGTVTGLFATDSSVAWVVNTTMGEPTVLGGAAVTILWYLRVLVQNAAGYPAPLTAVTVTNATGAQVANSTTAAGGATPLLAIPERVIYAGGRVTTLGPQTVAAVHPSLGRAHLSANITRYTALGLQLDNGTPSTQVSYDGPNPTGWFLDQVTVTLRATDDRADGVSLFWRVGQGPFQAQHSNGTTATVSIPFSREGESTLEFYSSDAAGNVEALHGLLIAVDSSPPTASFAELATVVYATPLALSWSGSDGTGSGVVSFQLNYSYHGSPFRGWLNATSLTSGLFDAADGSYEFRVRAYDAAGRESAPASLTVRVALLGSVRMRVVDSLGLPVQNFTVEVNGTGISEQGSGTIVIAGLPPGMNSLRVSAPGFEPRVVDVNVTAGAQAEFGDLPLAAASPAGGGFDLTAGYLAMAALLALTAAYYVRMRQRWERRRRQRETEARDQKETDKAKRRR